MAFLFEKYDTYDEVLHFQENIPNYISQNLAYHLRDYQKQGLGRFLHFAKENHLDNEQLLFNMATGSGKTMMMAALMIEKFKQGERNFIFLVDNSNIVMKTRDNFLNSTSSKYLFANKIMVDNQLVSVREVQDFSSSSDDSINIIFTTIQGLHSDLNTPRENSLSYEQFEDLSVVILADEAHHLNAGLGKSEQEENTSWTKTIELIQEKAKKSSILEFTATIDLTNADVAKKYEDKLLYKYDLKSFRLDGFSKDVLFHLVDGDTQSRMLQAMIISQYRKKVALKHGINLKPLVFFKSKIKADNNANFEEFKELLLTLSVSSIEKQKQNSSEGILKNAFDFFEAQHIEVQDLIYELQEDFRVERTLIIDGNTKTDSKLVLLNTLENADNEIRAIFAVDMLNEGWDVLNLFDIVRLYDTRDGQTMRNGSYKPGATTNTEKQLIGRGARYFPFVMEDDSQKYVRKFDDDLNNELRVIEQLHYHSANNPRYISELKDVLQKSGIYDESGVVERELKLKEEFKQTLTYQSGVVWINQRQVVHQTFIQSSIFGEEQISLPERIEVVLQSFSSKDYNAFDESEIQTVNDSSVQQEFDFKQIVSDNVLRYAINRNKSFSFDVLSSKILGIPSMKVFMQEVGNIKVNLMGSASELYRLSQENKLFIAEKVLQVISAQYIEPDEKFVGTTKFESKAISELFKDEIKRKYTIDSGGAEFGMPQKTSEKYTLNLDNASWYAYDENFGTSEEKSFVLELHKIIQSLEEKWSDIYLLRNEKALQIYSFDEGRAFEPDFLLFANDKTAGNISWQIFVEPKGSQFLDSNNEYKESKEGWKEKFLLQISKKSEAKTLVDNDRYHIIGLPLYNESQTKAKVMSELKDLR
ncbi:MULTISPECIES: DEAD/DEAH box helicase family protein [Lactococcus]|uniref:DEAD/DEAH box helicase family protein n=1 Tax=Lactococcus TaxID=1357 RepID=UPI0013FE012F|nr:MULTISPECIES: DEAD/DEAH box helicase family protein [Lactococcus]MCR8689129.1 DEAD/DEAH box helicase family protein [Lactococcus petauri]NHI70525.1 DEAD/DEAH box helicase [Lactococcus garvieae]NHJ08343.1 DEAD/DEAH box helicase [Lactococcus garvieae]